MIRMFLLALASYAGFAQTPAASAFEVASVKAADPYTSSGRDFRLSPGGRLTITNIELYPIVQQAFQVKPYQISGGPAWLKTDRFDIAAKAEGDPSRDQMLAMLRTLLAERFQLKTHMETKEGEVFALVVAKNGPKLNPPTGERTYIGLHRNTPTDHVGVDYTIGGQKATMALFAEKLADFAMRRPVLDRTNLKGEYDFKVRYATDDNPETGAPIVVAIQEQLGLKLERTKGPIETLVIDHAEKPSGN